MMNLYVPYLLSISIIFTLATTINFGQICECSALVYEENCNNTFGVCKWQGTTCEDVPCQDILYYDGCNYAPERCYWSIGGCQNFTSCSSIRGYSQRACYQSNKYCPASNGTYCGSIEQLDNCSAYTQDSCNFQYSQEGICVWDGNQCVLASSCSQFQSIVAVPCYFQGCQEIDNTCQPKTCQDHTNQQDCRYGVLTLGPLLQNNIACQWNSTTSTCGDFDPSTVDLDQCLRNSLGTYCWSDSNLTKGSCQKCFGRAFQTIVLILISILL